MISQEDGARLMAAAHKWVEARLDVLRAANRINPEGYDYLQAHQRVKAADVKCDAAERAFAELVAKLTDSEGL